jgi:tyrosyl-tRNA synthetase
MASRALISKLPSTRPAIYSTCISGQRSQVRFIATSYLKKVAEAEARWKEKGEKIKNGEIPHPWDILEERGYIKDVAGYATLGMMLKALYLTYTTVQPRRSRRSCV